MKAGLLREWLVFKAPEETRSPSGAVKKEYVEVFRCRANRRKMSVLAGEVSAMEQFIGHTIIMQVRRYPLIKENLRVSYNGNEYSIKMINPQMGDNTLLLTLDKIDV